MISRYQIDTIIYDIEISNTMEISEMMEWISLGVIPMCVVQGRISANMLSSQGVEK
jgi:hypothetical protein